LTEELLRRVSILNIDRQDHEERVSLPSRQSQRVLNTSSLLSAVLSSDDTETLSSPPSTSKERKDTKVDVKRALSFSIPTRAQNKENVPPRSYIVQAMSSTRCESPLPYNSPVSIGRWTNITVLSCRKHPGLVSIEDAVLLLPSLRHIDCSFCTSLKRLPDRLPPAFESLLCRFCCDLEALPAPLPPGLRELDCSFCGEIVGIPALPEGLVHLSCAGCRNLTRFPLMPVSLRRLSCGYCSKPQRIPLSPGCLLEQLDCHSCSGLIGLPEPLPHTLRFLDCSNCYQLTRLPPLPRGLKFLTCACCYYLMSFDAGGDDDHPSHFPAGMEQLNCMHCCSLRSLPALPDAIARFNINSTGCYELHRSWINAARRETSESESDVALDDDDREGGFANVGGSREGGFANVGGSREGGFENVGGPRDEGPRRRLQF